MNGNPPSEWKAMPGKVSTFKAEQKSESDSRHPAFSQPLACLLAAYSLLPGLLRSMAVSSLKGAYSESEAREYGTR